MAETSNTDHLTKLILAWNVYEKREESGSFSSPQYKGLSLSFNAKEWREDHAESFPQFCEFQKSHPYSVSRRFVCGDWYLPPSIIKMLIEQEVTYAEVAELITLILKHKDLKEKRVLLPYSEHLEGEKATEDEIKRSKR